MTFGAWTEHYERVQKRVWFDLPSQDVYDVDTIRESVIPYWTQFDRNFETNTCSAYIKGQVRLGGALSVSAGVRAHFYEMDYFDDLGAEARSFDDGVPFLPQLGVVFDVAGEHQLFGSVSRNFSQVPDDAVRQNAPVDSEPSLNVDVGYRFLRPGLSTSIAGYYVKYSDKIESIQLAPYDRYANETALQNVGSITGIGVEITGDYALTDALSVFTSANVSSATYDGDVPDSSEEGGILPIDGNDQVFTPRFQGFGEVSYRLPAGVTLAVNGKYMGNRKASLSGPVGGDSAAQEELDGYFLLGASARYDWRRFSLSLSGVNLTDTEYLAATSGIGPGTSRRPGGGTYFPGSPRWITFGVGARF